MSERSGRRFNKNKFFFINIALLLTLLSLIVLSLPKSLNGEITDHTFSIKNPTIGNTKITFTPDPSISALESSKNGDKEELLIPFFIDDRFVVVKNYIPFIGQVDRIYLLKALSKYEFKVIVKKTKLILTFDIYLLLISLIITVLLSRYKRTFTAFLILLIYTILTKVNIIILIPLILIFFIFNLKIKKAFKGLAIFLAIAIPLTVTPQHKEEINFKLLSNSEIASKAITLIKAPKDVSKAIDYTEKGYTGKNGLSIYPCHAALHILGMMAYLKLRDSVEALKYANIKCEFGYMHGVEDGITMLAKNIEDTKSMYAKGCKVLYHGNNFNTYDECVHGSGHAFYSLYNGDYEKAYQACKIWDKYKLTASDPVNVCNVAVTMSLGEHHAYLMDGVFIPSLCLKVKDELARNSCMRASFRYSIKNIETIDLDAEKGIAFCKKLSNERLKGSCMSSVGDATAFLYKDRLDLESPKLPLKYCLNGGSIDQNCYGLYIADQFYFHLLAGKPVQANYYCDSKAIEMEQCALIYDRASNRLNN